MHCFYFHEIFSLLFSFILTETPVLNLYSAACISTLYLGVLPLKRGKSEVSLQKYLAPCMGFCLCVGDRLCMHAFVFVCASSPLDGLLCLVCMVSVPTTAPMFAAVVVETSASGCSSLYFFVTCSDGYSTHSPSLHSSSFFLSHWLLSA